MGSMSDDYAKWYGDANMYNEVLVNSTLFWDNLPKSVAAFVYFDDMDAVKAGVSSGDMRLPDKIVAATNYVKFLDHYKLKELDVPLLKINRTGDMTITASLQGRAHSSPTTRTRTIGNTTPT